MKVFLAEHELETIEHIRNSLAAVVEIFDVQQNGDVALEFVLNNFEDYELIILDASLPKVDGAEICSRLREKNASLPVLMLVSPANLREQSPALSCGADDYLVKPFSEEEVLFRATSLLVRTTTFAPAIITREGVAFNVRERSITGSNVTLKLTVKETALLENFMLRPNEAITREELTTIVWGERVSPVSNRVDAHIKNLRKKLALFGGGQVTFRIESIRGKGYRFLEN